MKRALQPLLALLAVCVSCSATLAQELTRVEQVITLDAADAGKNPRPVRLSGTVVDVGADQKTFSLHDGSHTVGITFPSAVTMPAMADIVEIIGVTQTYSMAGMSYPRVLAQSLRITGHGTLPPTPPSISIAELHTFRHFDQWLSIEGRVARWKFRRTDNEVVIVIVDGTGFTTVSVRSAGRESIPTALMGAKLRLTGVNYSKNTLSAYGSMMIPSLQQMEILTPGNDDPYALPTTSAADIATRQTPPGSRVKVRGIVLGSVGQNVIYLRDGSHALNCILFPPWGNNLPYEEYYDGGPWPVVKPGDEIELLGSAMDTAQNPDMRGFSLLFCYARIIGSHSAPAPVTASLPDIVSGRHSFDLVQLRARLLNLVQIPTSKTSWRTTMILEADGKQLPLTHEATGFTSFDTARVDDELLITALVDEANARDPRQLWLLAPGDVKSLGVSPVVRSRQLWLYGGGGSAVVALLLGWIFLLRRSSRRQTRVTAELKAANESARESEQRWKLLFEQSPLSVQIFSPDGQTKRFNQAWKNLFRLNDEQGYAFNVLQAPDLIASGAVTHIQKAFQGEVVHVPPVPYPIPGDPPETRWIGGVLYPVKNADGQIIEVVTVHNDITESKRAAEALMEINHLLEKRVEERTSELQKTQIELQRALEQERELGELKSRFVTMVSHEFRTPLGIIMSAVELLQHYSDRLPEDEKARQLAEIQSSTKHMGGLMEQVLLLGRAEAGKLTCKPRPLDIVCFAERIIDETQSISNRKCPISLETSGDLSGASVDEALLRHILSNLVANAVKYSPDGAEVLLRIRREAREVVFIIIDRGIGIPEKDRARLFEAFHRCSNVGDTPGTGLGLVIVKRCVDLHGGTIELRSEPGCGTTFTVRLPLFS